MKKSRLISAACFGAAAVALTACAAPPGFDELCADTYLSPAELAELQARPDYSAIFNRAITHCPDLALKLADAPTGSINLPAANDDDDDDDDRRRKPPVKKPPTGGGPGNPPVVPGPAPDNPGGESEEPSGEEPSGEAEPTEVESGEGSGERPEGENGEGAAENGRPPRPSN